MRLFAQKNNALSLELTKDKRRLNLTCDDKQIVTLYSPEIRPTIRVKDISLQKLDDGQFCLVYESPQGRITRRINKITDGLFYFRTTLQPRRLNFINSWQDKWRWLLDMPDFIWAPNLRPESYHTIGDHCFRAPAIILQKKSLLLALVPDINLLKRHRPMKTCLDLDFKSRKEQTFGFGFKDYTVDGHTYYAAQPDTQLKITGRKLEFSYYLLIEPRAEAGHGYQQVVRFLWQQFAPPYLRSILPQVLPFEQYAQYAYNQCINSGDYFAFKIDGQEVGGIKNESSKPYVSEYTSYFGTSSHLLWNQVWYNNLCSAFGWYYWGKRLRKADWVNRAKKIKLFSLSAPTKQGLFPALYDYKNHVWEGSPRRLGGGRNKIHSDNASWTALWMLYWFSLLEADNRLLHFARDYADFLVRKQLGSGAIPAYFDAKTLKPVEPLLESAETSCSALFLSELCKLCPERRYQRAVRKAAEFLGQEVMPQRKYFDFETFFSCSVKPLDMFDEYSRCFPENTYSIYWTAHTLLNLFEVTDREEYLNKALAVLDHLSLYQQVWNPPFLSFYTFGGFGVMNTDGEWNDARQAVFAPLYFQAFRHTGQEEYIERGIAANRSSYPLFSIPENKKLNPKGWDKFPLGYAPENYGHGGDDNITLISDFGWGAGGALTGSALIARQFGDIFVSTAKGKAYSINGLTIKQQQKVGPATQLRIKEPFGYKRRVVIKTDEPKAKTLTLGPKEERKLII